MSKIPPFPLPQEPDATPNPHADTIAEAVRSLVETLPLDQQEQLLDALIRRLRPIPAPRAGEVLGEIVRLLPRRQQWTVKGLKERIDQSGITASPRDIYNALSYLNRKGRVRRVGYGRYVIDGAAVATSDDFGEASARNEDESSG